MRSAAIRQVVERLSNSRYRLWFVIILTLTLGLTVIWPLADDYKASRNQRSRLLADLARTRSDIEQLDQFQRVQAERLESLNKLEATTTSQSELQSFREQVIELAREAGCRVRTIRLGVSSERVWKPGDPVLTAATNTSTAKGPFTLATQTIDLSVTGSVDSLKLLLEQLHRSGKLMHTKKFQLKPAGQTEPGQLILDMDVLLFDLSERKAGAA